MGDNEWIIFLYRRTNHTSTHAYTNTFLFTNELNQKNVMINIQNKLHMNTFWNIRPEVATFVLHFSWLIINQHKHILRIPTVLTWNVDNSASARCPFNGYYSTVFHHVVEIYMLSRYWFILQSNAVLLAKDGGHSHCNHVTKLQLHSEHRKNVLQYTWRNN